MGVESRELGFFRLKISFIIAEQKKLHIEQGFPTFFVSRNTLDLKKFRGTRFKKITSEVVCFYYFFKSIRGSLFLILKKSKRGSVFLKKNRRYFLPFR